jgi:alcohol dehydrogenase (cytochrome c)
VTITNACGESMSRICPSLCVAFTRLLGGGAFAMAVLVAASCSSEQKKTVANVSWRGYNDTREGQRFSALDQIDTRNVTRLGEVCELRLGEEGPFQMGPVVIGDTMFITTSRTTVAMNATTCAVRWRHVDQSDEQDPIAVNRGVAYLDGRLFRGMPGGRVAAFEASTGKVLWDVKAGDPSIAEFLSSAPVAWKGTVYIGTAGGDWGIRGRVMAYDAATGREKWRFHTIPMGAERGAASWHVPATAERGGGGLWTSYTLDTLTGELFVPVGNPSPDFLPHVRPGDNLFTNSLVVLDAASGALKWWFQATPHDGFDWDLSAPPMLYTSSRGALRVALGSKDGFVYVLDRKSHDLVYKTAVTTILNADKAPTREGILACPGALGGVEWNGPALDPVTRTMYVGAVDWCTTYVRGEAKYKPGDIFMGTASSQAGADSALGWVVALEGDGGAVRWKFHTPSPVVAGLTPTAGNLLFTGDLAGNFYALDRTNGKVLLNTNVGGAIAGGVVTYSVAGTQYVATTAGNVSRMTFKTTGSPRIVVMALDGGKRSVTRVALPPVQPVGNAEGPTVEAGSTTAHGQQLFLQYCTGCHGSRGEGASGPSLTGAKGPKDLEAIVAFVKNPASPMPKLYPQPLAEADVRAVAEYVRVLQQPAKP